MTPEQRKSHARELLGNPVLQEVLANIEAKAVSDIIHAAPDAHAERMSAAADIRAARAITRELQSIVEMTAHVTVKSIA